MTQQLHAIMKGRVGTQQSASIRSLKSYSNYNIGDYLPNKDICHSRITTSVHRHKDKLSTQPQQQNDKLRQSDLNQLRRTNQLLQQEKVVLKAEAQCQRREADRSRVLLQKSQKENSQLIIQLKQLQTEIASLHKPKLLSERNVHQTQLFPMFKQYYQVSVQTEPFSEQVQYNKEKKATGNSQMEHIYQKLDSLKMGKSSKPSIHKQTVSMKTQRPRGTSYNWMGSSDKENLMRNSNMFERPTGTKLDQVREETINLHCLPLQVGQKMLEAYLHEPFI